MSKHSVLEKALLQVETLEEAVKKNSKEILRSTMKEDLYDILKEKDEEEEENPEVEDDMSDDNVDTDDKVEDEDMSDDKDEDDEEDDDNDEDVDDDDMDTAESMDDEDSMDDSFEDDEESMDDDEEPLDMTGASDDEVLKVFKAMKPEDGIVVKREGNQITFEDDEEEYIIKLDDDDSSSGEMNEEEEEEVVYEIDLDDEEIEEMHDSDDMEDEEEMYESDDMEDEVEMYETDETLSDEEEMGEAARTIGFGVRGPRQKKMFKAGRPDLQEAYNKLKKQNQEYKKALALFKDKLNEVALFNANLTYATRLFAEQTTTKKEKLKILERFDSVNTISESKLLFESIKNELSNKKPIAETVVDKIITTPKSSTTEVLSEAKAYENPEFTRIKELMKKIK